MHHNTRCTLSALAIAAAFTLTGCGSGPSEAEIQQALTTSANEAMSPMKQLGVDLGIKVLAVNKIGCEPAKEGKSYVCEFTSKVEGKNMITGATEVSEHTDKASFIQTDKGWVMM